MRIQKFEFRNFEDAAGEPAAYVPYTWDKKPIVEVVDHKIPDTSVTQEELEAREKAAYEKGLIQGKEEGYASAKSEIEENLEAIKACMHHVASEMSAAAGNVGEQVKMDSQLITSIIMASLKKLVGDVEADKVGDMLLVKISDYLAHLNNVPKLAVWVHPDLQESIESRMIEAKNHAGFNGEVTVNKDDSFAHADLRLTWASGKLEISQQKIISEIENILSSDTGV